MVAKTVDIVDACVDIVDIWAKRGDNRWEGNQEIGYRFLKRSRSTTVSTFTPLRRSFFQPSASRVASQLLGHWLIRKLPDGYCGGPIVETEAYLGDNDPASHAYRGETARNRVMFGPPGFAYVYFIYGFHSCVNAVCHRSGRAEAVLIRAIEAEFGVETMRKNRVVDKEVALGNGPGKLCAALAIDRKLDGADLCDAESPLFIARNPQVSRFRRQRGPVVIDTRIGITQAAHLPLRFFLGHSPFISRPARGGAVSSSE